MTLTRRTPLARTGGPARSGAPSPVGRKAQREAGALIAFRAAITARSGGYCELGTPACSPGPHAGHHAHHCAPSDRDRGVHVSARGLHCCVPGHRWVHANPAVSYERGWLIRSGS